MIISRTASQRILKLAGIFPAVGIVGPRQVGKTTLVREQLFAGDSPAETLYLDLESPRDRARLAADAFAFLEDRSDKRVVIDEIQVMPELFTLMRPLIDADRRPGRFILLGSASPQLVRGASESLAGRIGYHELTPLQLGELEPYPALLERHWLCGGYPEAVLPEDVDTSEIWREQYLESYISRDLPRLGVVGEPQVLSRLLLMLSGINSQLLNLSNLSRSLGVTQATVKSYTNLLEQSFLIRLLQPFHVNVRKRLVKAPKVYIRDSGLLHSLLGISTMNQLTASIDVGGSWEGYVIEQIISGLASRVRPHFYRTHAGAEIDLVLIGRAGRIACVEVKRSSAPVLTKGFHNARQDLGPSLSLVVAPVKEAYSMGDGIQVVPLEEAMAQLADW